MAVVGFAKEMPEGRRAAFLENNRRQYTRVFRVVTDTPFDGAQTAKWAVGVPGPYADYITQNEVDLNCKVVRITPQQASNSRLIWYVTVDYDTEFERKDGDPFAEPPKIAFDFEPFREPLPGVPLEVEVFESPGLVEGGVVPPTESYITNWGSGIVNSAGEPFNPPAERDAARPIVTYTRNEPNFSVATAVRYINSVNRTAWSGLQSRQALIKGIRSQRQIRLNSTFGQSDIVFWETTYVFALKRETWDLQLLNIGSYSLSQAATFDEEGNVSNAGQIAKVPAPDGAGGNGLVLLKADGTLATDGKPTFRNFRVYKEESFAALNIVLNLST